MIGSIVVWNVRGLGTSKQRLKRLIRHFNPSMLSISEPFVDEEAMDV